MLTMRSCLTCSIGLVVQLSQNALMTCSKHQFVQWLSRMGSGLGGSSSSVTWRPAFLPHQFNCHLESCSIRGSPTSFHGGTRSSCLQATTTWTHTLLDSHPPLTPFSMKTHPLA